MELVVEAILKFKNLEISQTETSNSKTKGSNIVQVLKMNGERRIGSTPATPNIAEVIQSLSLKSEKLTIPESKEYLFYFLAE
jgi:hypothetical protein